MLFYPHAKINIGLQVLRKRGDGFHDISTLMYPVDWCDALEFVPLDGTAQMEQMEDAANAIRVGQDLFSTSGLPIPGSTNLCTDVLEQAHRSFNFPSVHLHLHKIIPMGAGLGGGSSDATFLWKALNSYWGWGLSEEEIRDRALQHGSDCPFFATDGPALAEGRGERLTPVESFLHGVWVVILHEGIHISTAKAYAAMQPLDHRPSLLELIQQPRAMWRQIIENDFENFAFAQHPVLERQVGEWYDAGAFYAGLTGSGSAIFALFEEEPNFSVAEEKLGRRIFRGRLA